jgi:putative nucleotidyltransferase with HDIG domain
MAKADRRESIAVARRTAAALAGTEWDGDDRYLAAALLHDVGKSDARLGPIGRALATMAGAVAGHQMAPAWQARGGIARRFGVYLRHDEIGAGMLRLAGAPSAAVEWAEAHHHPERWPALTAVPLPVAEALARADGEQVTSVSGDECR